MNIKKIVAFDCGHGGLIHDRGLNGFCNEYQKNKEVLRSIMKYAKEDNLINFIITNPPEFSIRNLKDDLLYRVDVANKYNADIFVSIHHNAGGGNGTEVYSLTAEGMLLSSFILDEYVKIGYANRGVKNSDFFILKNTNMISCLVQGWYIDSKDYKNFNADKEARAILNGIYKYFNLIEDEEEKYHIVGISENLWQISKKLGVSMEYLKEKNSIRDINFLRIGDKIYY